MTTWITQILELRDEEQTRMLRADTTIIGRLRPHVRTVVESEAFQSFVALLLFTNFALNIIEVETKPAEDSEFNNALNTLDLVFTVFYVIELALNLFVNWWRPFITNGWSIFDALCVLSSVIGALLSEYGDGKIDLSVIRSIRIFKIVRIFSRLKALQRIVTAITTTLYPLLNTFIIFVVVVSIYSVLACQLYGDLFPERFGAFTTAALTMFQLCTGDGWMTDVVRPLMTKGMQVDKNFNVLAGFFFISYILFVAIVLLNVAVAVLLEGFLNAISNLEMQERTLEAAQEYNTIAGPLDPLIATLANFHSEEHLSSQIRMLYGFFDVDGDGISFDEFEAGLAKIDLRPRMHINKEDFSLMLSDIGIAGDTDHLHLDQKQFDQCLRLQLRHYTQRLVAHQMTESISNNRIDTSTEFFAHKMLISEIFQISKAVSHHSKLFDDLFRYLPGDTGRYKPEDRRTPPGGPGEGARREWDGGLVGEGGRGEPGGRGVVSSKLDSIREDVNGEDTHTHTHTHTLPPFLRALHSHLPQTHPLLSLSGGLVEEEEVGGWRELVALVRDTRLIALEVCVCVRACVCACACVCVTPYCRHNGIYNLVHVCVCV